MEEAKRPRSTAHFWIPLSKQSFPELEGAWCCARCAVRMTVETGRMACDGRYDPDRVAAGTDMSSWP